MQFSVIAVLAAAGLASALPATQASAAAPTTTSGLPAGATCSAGPVVNYAVVANDTLTIVSQRLNSGICNIAKASALTNPNFIALGQVLKVPTFPCELDNTSCLAKPSDQNTCVKGGPSTYTIASGDTFFLVAQKFNLAAGALAAANQGLDPLLLQVGQVLNIPVCK